MRENKKNTTVKYNNNLGFKIKILINFGKLSLGIVAMKVSLNEFLKSKISILRIFTFVRESVVVLLGPYREIHVWRKTIITRHHQV